MQSRTLEGGREGRIARDMRGHGEEVTLRALKKRSRKEATPRGSFRKMYLSLSPGMSWRSRMNALASADRLHPGMYVQSILDATNPELTK